MGGYDLFLFCLIFFFSFLKKLKNHLGAEGCFSSDVPLLTPERDRSSDVVDALDDRVESTIVLSRSDPVSTGIPVL